MSRFKKADDVLILQPFDMSVFQQGTPDQPQLLLSCIGKEESEVKRLMKEYEEDIKAQRAMKETALREKRAATMKQNAQELNAKRAAKAAMESWICTQCNEEKPRLNTV